MNDVYLHEDGMSLFPYSILKRINAKLMEVVL